MPLLPAGAARGRGPPATPDSRVELGPNRVGVREEQIGGVPDFLSREAVAVARAPEAGSVAAEIAALAIAAPRKVSADDVRALLAAAY